MSRYLIFAALLLITPGCADESAATAHGWLEKSHQAAGGAAWDEVRNSRARFGLDLPGMSGKAETVTDLTTGRYFSEAAVGPFRFVNGLDDTVQWSLDSSGRVEAPDTQADREATVSERYRRMLAYWYPHRWPAELADLGQASEEDRSFRRISITPKGGRAFEFWIDEQTALIDRVIENDGSGDQTIYLYDYRSIDGRHEPHATRYSTGEAGVDQFTTLLSMEFNIKLDEGMFARPAQ